MLLRVYRLTDKFGIVLLKLGAAFADWLLDGASAMLRFFGGGTGRVFGFLSAFVLIIGSFLWTIVKGLGRVFTLIFGRFGGATGKAVQTSARAGGAAVSDAMARRAARDEIDVVIKEDPLRVQNRRLSFIVLLLGVIVVGALYYATDPNRLNVAVPIAVVPNNDPELPLATPENNQTVVVDNSSNRIPTAAPLPEPLRARGAIAYTVRERGQTDIWALQVGSGNPIRITNSTADERDPEWSPSGTRLAYASHNNGNWDIFVYNPLLDETSPLTVDLAFQANPTWSHDEAYIAYENYLDNNLEIYAYRIDGSDPAAINLTQNPAADYSPAWEPANGRRIAFISLRDGNQEIYILNLEDESLTNLTNSPLLNEENPVWSPDGRFIAYSAWEQGNEKVYVIPSDGSAAAQVIALGRTPAWSPDGASLAFTVDSLDGSRTDLMAVTVGAGNLPVLISAVNPQSIAPTWTSQPLPTSLVNRGGLDLAVDDLFVETIENSSDGLFRLRSLGTVQTEAALLSDAVNDSFDALRQRIVDEAGLDYLVTLDDAFWDINRPADSGVDPRSWFRTGRAFAISSNGIRGLPPPIEVVREDIGLNTYWRIFVRVDDNFQRGQLGEPLRRLPWDFLAADSGTNVDAFNQGGAYRQSLQAGYYIDFTQYAADYGWERLPASNDWRANSRGRNYWLFVNDGGLTWCEAMLQQYNEGQLINYGCTN